MKNTTIGVDPTISYSSDGPVSAFSSTSAIDTPAAPIDFSKLPEGTYYGFIHASNVQYYMAKLLGNALSLVDSSIPNKEQNKAMKHLLRKQFDSALMDVHNMAWPSSNDPACQKGHQASNTPVGNGYMLQPES
jgi:hypothetical protein